MNRRGRKYRRPSGRRRERYEHITPQDDLVEGALGFIVLVIAGAGRLAWRLFKTAIVRSPLPAQKVIIPPPPPPPRKTAKRAIVRQQWSQGEAPKQASNRIIEPLGERPSKRPLEITPIVSVWSALGVTRTAAPRPEPPPQAKTELPYEQAPHLLTKGEQAFWFPLYRAVQGRYRIFPKVRLADVVIPRVPKKEERDWFLKIGSFHLDYVLCDPETTRPVLVVELDDHSHASEQRRQRDEFKDAVLAAAGLRIYRVSVQQAYEPAELAREIDRLIGERGSAPPAH